MPKNNRYEENERSLAYVGMTRAQDILYIIAKTKTGYVTEIENILKEMN